MATLSEYIEQEQEKLRRIQYNFEWEKEHPLVTAYTRLLNIPDQTLDKMARVRRHDPALLLKCWGIVNGSDDICRLSRAGRG